jgi:hypothetical protein
MLTDDTRHGLNTLDLAWGFAYDIGISDGKYYALRTDGTGDVLTRDNLDELNAAIRADWAREQVL